MLTLSFVALTHNDHLQYFMLRREAGSCLYQSALLSRYDAIE